MHDRPDGSGDPISSSGVFVNTMGWVDGLGYQLLLHSIAVLQADIVVVLGQERLHSRLKQEYRNAGQSVEIIFLPASGGVVLREKSYRSFS